MTLQEQVATTEREFRDLQSRLELLESRLKSLEGISEDLRREADRIDGSGGLLAHKGMVLRHLKGKLAQELADDAKFEESIRIIPAI